MPSFVIITYGAARLSSFKYVGHGYRGDYWSRFRSGSQTPVPSPTESTTPRGRIRAALPPWLIARRYQWRESTMRARQEGDRNPAG